MMTNMQARARRTQATPEFVDLVATLYGDVIDAQLIWQGVTKASPDSADVHAPTTLRTKFERGSNAVGFTAGLMATGSALRDPRFAEGGKTSQRLHAAAKKIPNPISRIEGRTGAKLAAGALAVQAGNIIGDGTIAATYADKSKKPKKTRLVRTHPAGRPKTAVDKSVAADLAGAATKIKNGYLKLWNPKSATTAVPPIPGTRAARKSADAAAATKTKNTTDAARQTAQGKDLGTMLSTKSGKAATGALGAIGASKVNTGMANKRNAGLTYAPDSIAYGKSDDCEFAGEFSKFDDDKHLAFGWASMVSKGGHPVIDKQGDYISIEDIETAAYTYVNKSRVGGDNHTRDGQAAHKVSDLVESMVFTDDKVAKMGLPEDFPRGWWVGFKVHDEDTWSEVRKGNRTGFSIHGKGMRRDQSVDEIMGYQQ